MPKDTLASVLAGEFQDPDDGQLLLVPVRTVVIEDDLAGREADLVGALALGERLAVVSDPTTYRVLGGRVVDALETIAWVQSVVLFERPQADLATVERIRSETQAASALVAVGSGTINDLCKYASASIRSPMRCSRPRLR